MPDAPSWVRWRAGEQRCGVWCSVKPLCTISPYLLFNINHAFVSCTPRSCLPCGRACLRTYCEKTKKQHVNMTVPRTFTFAWANAHQLVWSSESCRTRAQASASAGSDTSTPDERFVVCKAFASPASMVDGTQQSQKSLDWIVRDGPCLLYTSPSPRDRG